MTFSNLKTYYKLIVQTVLRQFTKYAKIYLFKMVITGYNVNVYYWGVAPPTSKATVGRQVVSISGSSNGRTPGFGPGNLGSNTSPEAKIEIQY